MKDAFIIFIFIIGFVISLPLLYKKLNKNFPRLTPSETNGIFMKNNVDGIVCFIAGLLLCGIFCFIEMPGGRFWGITVGVITCIGSIAFHLFNHEAYLHIDDGHIKGKYHYFGKIDCATTDVAFAIPQINTLTILLKNGKRHVIMGIENSQLLAAEIRRQIFTVETDHPESLHRKIAVAQAAKKKKLIWVIVSFIMMFANIFLAVALTDGRDMHEFSNLDWFLFVAVGTIEIVTVAAMFIFADQCGKYQLPIAHLKHRLKGAYIASHPLPAGNIKRIYTDENNKGRIIVCGFPNDESVYCIIQQFVTPSQLETVHTTEIYENESAFAEDLIGYIDITTHFQ